jgi:hypothetical protein
MFTKLGQLKAGDETSVVPGANFFGEIRPEAFGPKA